MDRNILSILIISLAFNISGSAAFADGKKPVTPIHFTKEQQEQYYPVYERPQVIFLRKALNAYLQGDGRSEEKKELAKFSSDYYKSKFIVFSFDPCPLGGTFLTIMFQDTPDKVFTAWIYDTSDHGLELRSMELAKFDDEQIGEFRIRYKEFLDDKVHAL